MPSVPTHASPHGRADQEENSARFCTSGGGRERFGALSCLGRSPRKQVPLARPPPVTEPEPQPASAGAHSKLLMGEEVANSVKDIHWIVEKALTMLHEIHQDHLVTKHNAKMHEAKMEKMERNVVSPELLFAIKKSVMEAVQETTSWDVPAVLSARSKAFQVHSEALPRSTPGKTNLQALTPTPADTIVAGTKVKSEVTPRATDTAGIAMIEAAGVTMIEAVQEMKISVQQTCTQQCELWGERILQTIHKEFESGKEGKEMEITRSSSKTSVETYTAMNIHAEVLQTTNDEMTRVMGSLSKKMDQFSKMLAQKIDKVDGRISAVASDAAAPGMLSDQVPSGSPSQSRHSTGVAFRPPDSNPDFWEVKDQLMQQVENEYISDKDVQDVKDDYAQEMAWKGAGDTPQQPKLKEDQSFSAVFANDTDLGKPLYDVEALYHDHGCSQALARRKRFNMVSNFMVMANAIYIGVEADHNEVDNLYNAAWAYIIMENVFCFYFTFEFVVRFTAFRRVSDCLADGWMRFDLLLVSTMIIETWLLMPILYYGSGNEVRVPTGPLRLLRILKVTRMARMMKAFPELVTMVKGMLRSLRAITGSIMLVLVLLYVFSMFIFMLLKNEDALNKVLQDDVEFEFSTLPWCMWTMGMAGAFLLDGAANIATHLVWSKKPNIMLAGWTYIVFTLITAMTVLQMLIGVLCEVIETTKKEHEQAKVVAIMKQQLVTKLKQFDDGDGRMTQKELASVMADPECKTLMRSLNINRLFLLEMQKLMFPKKESTVAFKPLTEMMLACRGDQNATVETVASGLSYLVSELRREMNMVSLVARKVDVLSSQFNAHRSATAQLSRSV